MKFTANSRTKTVTVIESNGNIITTTDNFDELISLLRNNELEKAYQKLKDDYFSSEEKFEMISEQQIIDNISTSDVFQIKEGLIYYKNIDVPVPKEIYKRWMVANDDYKQSLEKFWMLLVLNPNTRVREEIVAFLDNTGFILSKNGMIVTLRQGYKEERDIKSIETIRKSVENPYKPLYDKIKGQKKAPKNFYVHSVDGQLTAKSNSLGSIGNLEELYNKYTGEEVTTNEVVTGTEVWYKASHHSDHEWFMDGVMHDGRMYYKVGSVTTIPIDYCDTNSRNTCSKGIHSAAWGYNGESFSFGDTNLLCLVNPYDVLSVPEDGAQKIRSTSIYIVKELEQEEYLSYKDKSLEILDDDYFNQTLNEMVEMIEQQEYSRDNDIVPEHYTLKTIQSIKNHLEDARVTIKNRVAVMC